MNLEDQRKAERKLINNVVQMTSKLNFILKRNKLTTFDE